MQKDHPTSWLFLWDGLLVTTQNFLTKHVCRSTTYINVFPNIFTLKKGYRVTLHSLSSPDSVICSTQGNHFTTKPQTCQNSLNAWSVAWSLQPSELNVQPIQILYKGFVSERQIWSVSNTRLTYGTEKRCCEAMKRMAIHFAHSWQTKKVNEQNNN